MTDLPKMILCLGGPLTGQVVDDEGKDEFTLQGPEEDENEVTPTDFTYKRATLGPPGIVGRPEVMVPKGIEDGRETLFSMVEMHKVLAEPHPIGGGNAISLLTKFDDNNVELRLVDWSVCYNGRLFEKPSADVSDQFDATGLGDLPREVAFRRMFEKMIEPYRESMLVHMREAKGKE